MEKSKVRSTIEPGVVIEVDAFELTDLDRQGLIHSSESGEYGRHKWKPADEESAEAPASKAEKKGA